MLPSVSSDHRESFSFHDFFTQSAPARWCRQSPPTVESCWASLAEYISRWGEIVVDSAGSYGILDEDGDFALLEFGPDEFHTYLTQITFRKKPVVEGEDASYVTDWYAIEDVLLEIIGSGFPMVGLRGPNIVGLSSRGGKAWEMIDDDE